MNPWYLKFVDQKWLIFPNALHYPKSWMISIVMVKWSIRLYLKDMLSETAFVKLGWVYKNCYKTKVVNFQLLIWVVEVEKCWSTLKIGVKRKDFNLN